MAYEQYGSATVFRYIVHLADGTFLELGVTDGEDLVNDEDFGFEEGGDGEAETDCHTGTIAFYRSVDVFLYAGELDDIVELALDLMLCHAEDGTVHVYVLLAGELSVETGADLKE
jgi:hypothetical protein